jgi:hypothetical protein
LVKLLKDSQTYDISGKVPNNMTFLEPEQ